MARHRRRRRFHVSGSHKLAGTVKIRRRRFTLKRRSPFKRRLRGFKINPYVAEYLMNPRRRRGGRRRRHSYRSNPAGGVMRAMTGVFDLRYLQHGAIATAGTLATLTIGNLALTYIAPYAPAVIRTGYLGIATKAAVRAGVAWALDAYVVSMLTRDHTSFRVGAAIGIVGSAVLELMGTRLIIGMGDTGQTPQSFIPGMGSYINDRNLQSYIPAGRVSMAGLGALNVGHGSQLGTEAHQRIYGYGN